MVPLGTGIRNFAKSGAAERRQPWPSTFRFPFTELIPTTRGALDAPRAHCDAAGSRLSVSFSSQEAILSSWYDYLSVEASELSAHLRFGALPLTISPSLLTLPLASPFCFSASMR